MLAIITKYHGPTDHKGARVSAHAPDHKSTGTPWRKKFFTYDYECNGSGSGYDKVATQYVQEMHERVLASDTIYECAGGAWLDDGIRVTLFEIRWINKSREVTGRWKEPVPAFK